MRALEATRVAILLWQPVLSLLPLQELYGTSQSSQLSFVKGLTVGALDRPVENPWAQDLKGTVAEILMPVILQLVYENSRVKHPPSISLSGSNSIGKSTRQI
jgi:hypothetical protein